MMGGWGSQYGYGGGSFTWIGMGLMMCLWLVMLLGLIAIVVWFVRSSSRGPAERPGQPPSEACEIAKQRYARGEITKDEYTEICHTLKE